MSLSFDYADSAQWLFLPVISMCVSLVCVCARACVCVRHIQEPGIANSEATVLSLFKDGMVDQEYAMPGYSCLHERYPSFMTSAVSYPLRQLSVAVTGCMWNVYKGMLFTYTIPNLTGVAGLFLQVMKSQTFSADNLYINLLTLQTYFYDSVTDAHFMFSVLSTFTEPSKCYLKVQES